MPSHFSKLGTNVPDNANFDRHPITHITMPCKSQSYVTLFLTAISQTTKHHNLSILNGKWCIGSGQERWCMMRLLNVQTLALEKFDHPPYPPYAIVSHTWGVEAITFQDIQDLEKASKKAGFEKLKLASKMATMQQLQYVWIDTCCIDISSSAELSEALNSIYQWYRSSSKCLVYLEDLPSSITTERLDGSLGNCRWFSKAWALQELVAPQTVVFYNQEWDIIGEKTSASLLSKLSQVTGIHQDVLLNPDLVYTTSLAVRMSWAADRATSRQEDIAYCLLGLFNVTMPILYGEGNKAFRRLQEELIKNSNDLSIFAWCDEEDVYGYRGILADSPQVFRNFRSTTFGTKPFYAEKEYRITNKGLRITAKILKYPARSTIFMGLREDESDGNQIGILLQNDSGVYVRIHSHRLFKMGPSFWHAQFETFYVWTDSTFLASFRMGLFTHSPLGSPKISPRETSDIVCIGNDGLLQDAVSWGSLCSYCVGKNAILNTPKHALKTNSFHAQSPCISNFKSRTKDDSLESGQPASYRKQRHSTVPKSYDAMAGTDGASPRARVDDVILPDRGKHLWRRLGDDKHNNGNQFNPFNSSRNAILDIAIREFEDYKTRWFSGVSREYASTNLGALPFACPFVKMDICEYRRCLIKTRIRTSAELIEHLVSTHRQPLYCPICTITFQDIWTRDSHIRERSCEKAELALPPGMSIEQGNHLRLLLSTQPLDEECWYRVWDVLFPEEARPQSASIDKQFDITMSALQSFWVDHGSNLISGFLQSQGKLEWKVPNEEHGLADLYSTLLSDLVERYLLASLSTSG
ncbi:hypothetical protein NUW58_g20 [Xylaria curta]|uniref:Uncharacterized protein n=1 Tax=Xylaria curta TaxID=42375 RepID=A0ACC1PTQ3_9PEZI|nr:hypothetical protein NUW58_g20 [Xylaria curta]